MTARELFDLCSDNSTDCNEKCPYAEKREECEAINDAIHVLRHPSWYVNKKLYRSVDNVPSSQIVRK